MFIKSLDIKSYKNLGLIILNYHHCLPLLPPPPTHRHLHSNLHKKTEGFSRYLIHKVYGSPGCGYVTIWY